MFKKGDKVRCIEGLQFRLTEGKIYEVIGTVTGHIKITDDIGVKVSHVLSRFELVQEDQTKSQHKELSKELPTWSCTYMGASIEGNSIEEIKEKFDQLGRELISKGNKFRYVK